MCNDGLVLVDGLFSNCFIITVQAINTRDMECNFCGLVLSRSQGRHARSHSVTSRNAFLFVWRPLKRLLTRLKKACTELRSIELYFSCFLLPKHVFMAYTVMGNKPCTKVNSKVALRSLVGTLSAAELGLF